MQLDRIEGMLVTIVSVIPTKAEAPPTVSVVVVPKHVEYKVTEGLAEGDTGRRCVYITGLNCEWRLVYQKNGVSIYIYCPPIIPCICVCKCININTYIGRKSINTAHISRLLCIKTVHIRADKRNQQRIQAEHEAHGAFAKSRGSWTIK